MKPSTRNLTYFILGLLNSACWSLTTYTVNVPTDASPSSGGSGSGTTGDLRFALNQILKAQMENKPETTWVVDFMSMPSPVTLQDCLPTINLHRPDTITISNSSSYPAIIDGNGNSYPGLTCALGTVNLQNIIIQNTAAEENRRGALFIDAATVNLQNFGVHGSWETTAIENHAIFDISEISAATYSIDHVTGSGIIRAGNKTILAHTISSFSGSIQGEANFVKHGTGVLTLTEQHTYTGDTIIQEGTLALSEQGSLSTSELSIAEHARFDLSQINSSTSTISSFTGSGNIALGNKTLITGSSHSTTFSGAISGDGGVVKMGSGAWTLTTAQPYAGTTLIREGILALAEKGSLTMTKAIVNEATLDISQLSFPFYTLCNIMGSGTISAGNKTIIVQPTSSYTFHGIIADGGIIQEGNASLIKRGPSTFTLTRSNTYTGGTLIAEGVLSLCEKGALSTTGTLTNNAILDLSQITEDTYMIGSLAGSGIIHAGNKAISIMAVNSSFYQGIIADGGIGGGSGASLIKQGAGTLTLTGHNTYTGGTVINEGTLALKAGGSFAAEGTLSLAEQATLDISQVSFSTTIPSLERYGQVALGSKTLVTGSSHSTIFSGTIKDGGINRGVGGSIVKIGSGILTLSGFNTYTGNTTIQEGTLALRGTGSIISKSIVNHSHFDISQLDYSSITLGHLTGSGILHAGNKTMVTEITTAVSYEGSIQDGGLYTNNLKDHELDEQLSQVFGPRQEIIADMLQKTSASFVKRGLGSFTLTGNNTYTGDTRIDEGILALKGNGSISATKSIVIAAKSIFDISQVVSSATISSLTGEGTAQLGSKTLIIGPDYDTTFFGLLCDGGLGGGIGGSIMKKGKGVLTFTGENSYTGSTLIAEGTLALSKQGGITKTKSIINHATFDISQLASSSYSINHLFGSGTLKAGNKIIQMNVPLTFSGTITDGGIGGGKEARLLKQGLNTCILTSCQSYTGGTTIAEGTLALSGNGSLSSLGIIDNQSIFDISQIHDSSYTIGNLTGPGTVYAGNKLILVNTSNSSTFNGAIIDGGLAESSGASLIKQGPGTLILNGENAYTGSTTVAAGNLTVNGSIRSSVTVNSNAVLSGSGTIHGAVAIAGQLAPEHTMTINGSATLSGMTTIQIHSKQPSSIQVNGTATLGGTLQIIAHPQEYNSAMAYTILTSTEGISGIFTNTSFPSRDGWNVQYFPDKVLLVLDTPQSLLFDIPPLLDTSQSIFCDASPLLDTPQSILFDTPHLLDVPQSVLFDTPPLVTPSPFLFAPDSVSTVGITGNALKVLNYLNANNADPNVSRLLTQLNTLSLDQLLSDLQSISPASMATARYISATTLFATMNILSSNLERFRLSHLRARKSTGIAIQVSQSPHLLTYSLNDTSMRRFFSKKKKKTELPPPKKDTYSFWAAPYGEALRQDAQEQNPTFHAHSIGALFGFDYFGWNACGYNKSLIGATAGFVRSDIKDTPNIGHDLINFYLLGFYGMRMFRYGTFELALLTGYVTYDNQRFIFTPDLNSTTSNKHHGWELAPHLNFSINTINIPYFVLTPFVTLDWAVLFENGYLESGPSNLNMKIHSQTSSILRSEAGLNFYQPMNSCIRGIVLREKISYINKKPFDIGRMTAALVSFSSSFTVDSFTKIQNLLGISGELSARFDNFFISACYDGEFGSGYINNQGEIQLGGYF